ncbi:MAG: hypothetical protein J6Y06_05320 [Bacteroidales bacterium]|nr:hypothetical protein [Bacteroidales bacterium]
MTLIAAAAIMVGCNPKEEEQPSLPVLNVGQTEISFEQGGGTASVTVTSNRPWTITSDADWLAFNPSNGTASSAPVNVTVTALANSSTDRNASFRVKTDFDYKTVNVTQKGSKGEDPNQTATGSGTASDPYNVYATIQKANSLVAYNSGDLTSENSANVYTKGKVVSVEIDPSYGNATYYISADGTATTQLEVYRGKYLNGANFLTKDQLKVGDEVVVYGPIVNFKGNTPEFTTGSKIISINGSSEAPVIDFTKFELITVKAFIDKKDNGQFFRLKGKVSKFNKQYCSFDLTDDSGTIYVYSVNNKEEWSEKISNGGTVELAGLYTYYEKNDQHEVVSAQILSFEAGSGGGDHSDAVAKTVADFIKTADNDTYFKLTGTVSGFNKQYCSFDLTDETGKIYVYSVANKADWSDKISNGGTVTLAGKYLYYESKDQHEVVEAEILSFEAGSGGGDHSDAVAKTVAEFITAADKDNYYKLTGSVSGFNSQYCSFDLTDATGKIYVYSVANKADWSSKISNGGTVTLAGKYDYYASKEQHEVIEAEILSFTPGDTPDAKAATVAEAIAAEKDAVLKVGPAVVVASASAGFLMEQDGARIYVYGGNAVVGDNVTVTGTRAEYGGAPQLTSPSVAVNSKGTKVTYPDAKDITSTADSYSSTTREFVTVKGKLNISGNYFNINITGVTVIGSIVKPVEDIASLNGKEVTIKGYYLYHTSQGKYLYVIATDINGTAITGEDGGSQGGGGSTDGIVITDNGESVDFSKLGFENSVQYKTISGTKNISITFGDGANDGKYYNTGTGIRIYGNGYVNIESSSKTIAKIVYTFASGKDYQPATDDVSTPSGYNASTTTWTGSAKSVKLTRPSGNGHWRLQKVEVTFAQ